MTKKTRAGEFDEPSAQISVTDNVIKRIRYCAFRIIGGDGVFIADNFCTHMNREGVLATSTKQLIIHNNIFQGSSQESAGKSNGIRLQGCTDAEAAYNIISNEGFQHQYEHAIYVQSDCEGIKLKSNSAKAGLKGNVRSDAADTIIEGESGERYLTGIMNVSTGIVDLQDDITNYKSLVVATGAVSDGNLRHEIARGWYTIGFRPGTDFINVQTAQGRFVAKILSNRQIQIIEASDSLRYIIGVL